MSTAHHLQIGPEHVAGNGGVGRIFLVPGSPARARMIGEQLAGHEVHENPRHHDVHLGHLDVDGRRVDVGSVSSGMGCPSLGIIVSELIELGVRRLARVGSSGSLQPHRVRIGDLVIATGAVRDEGASDAFCPRDVPAVAHSDWVRALRQAAVALGYADHTFAGLVHSKDSLYGREFPSGPQAEENARYMQVLERMGVLASEMETSHLFVLAAASGHDPRPISVAAADVVKAGAVVAVISDDTGWATEQGEAAAEARAVEVALRAATLVA